MRLRLLAILNFLAFQFSFGQLSSAITCWQINTTATGFAGAISNVQEVNYSNTFVYVKTEDIPSWIPVLYDWPNNPWFAVPMNYQFRFRLSPTPNIGVETKTGYGHIGLWKNGCSIYNPKDAKSFNDALVWFQNAWYWEHLAGETFDDCIGHPNQSGEYHTHVSPACLYSFEDSLVASPLLGYAFDSYPIYGGYGHEDPMDTTSSIIRLKSSYRLRNMTDRTTLPDGTVLTPSLYGPSINSVPLGGYMEDFEYIAGLGDLDKHNGRFAITKDYPNGIYTYHTTIGWVTDTFDNAIKPVFPYVLGSTYFGEVYPADGNTGPNSGFVVISEPVTPYLPGTTSVSEIMNPLNVSIFPNPMSESLYIDTRDMDKGQALQGMLYDSKGVFIDKWTLQTGTVNTIDGWNLVPGVYFVSIQSGTHSKNFNLIVQ